jgi:hypothetical protein
LLPAMHASLRLDATLQYGGRALPLRVAAVVGAGDVVVVRLVAGRGDELLVPGLGLSAQRFVSTATMRAPSSTASHTSQPVARTRAGNTRGCGGALREAHHGALEPRVRGELVLAAALRRVTAAEVSARQGRNQPAGFEVGREGASSGARQPGASARTHEQPNALSKDWVASKWKGAHLASLIFSKGPNILRKRRAPPVNSSRQLRRSSLRVPLA